MKQRIILFLTPLWLFGVEAAGLSHTYSLRPAPIVWQSQTGNWPLLLAEDKSGGAFDPFIDYGEFQENVAEEESINFFQHGRSLIVSFMAGYEGLTPNIRQIYGDAPFALGLGISFFFDLHLAFQVGGVFPTQHYNSLLGSSTRFMHYGIDLKYYFNRQYLKKEKEFFNPYMIIGSFWIQLKNQLSPSAAQQAIPLSNTPDGAGTSQEGLLSAQELKSQEAFSAFGGKVGLGFEVPLIKKSFIGMEIAYLYTNLEFENENLSSDRFDFPDIRNTPTSNLLERLLYPKRPKLDSKYRFSGDLFNVFVVLGVNF